MAGEGGAEGWEPPPPPRAGEAEGSSAAPDLAAPPPPPLLLEAPPGPAPAREPPARGHCLLGNWQEERATNELDRVPRAGAGTEGFYYRHGHPALLTLRCLARLSDSTTMHDSFRRPGRTGLPGRGQREAMTEWLLYQKYSKEVFKEDVDPPRGPMESLSTTHRDYRQEGFLSVPPAPTKPHDYRMEQPQTFWLEHARQVPGVSNIRTGDTPFRKNASFTTPTTENLDQLSPDRPENSSQL